jgi:N6-adenosine-specific RNA methylase IME4
VTEIRENGGVLDRGDGRKRYGVILADPSWLYRNGGNGRASAHYPLMETDAICALPIRDLAANDAVLLLWTTWPCLPDAWRVIAAWGFVYVSGLPWVKVQRAPTPDLWGEYHYRPTWGTGFWVRGCSEPLLICRRGHGRPPEQSYLGLISPNFGHSRKPDNVYEYAEAMPGPYLEVFARRRRSGWDAYGNEIEGSIALGADT